MELSGVVVIILDVNLLLNNLFNWKILNKKDCYN
jgi:hypothetical protein